MLRDKGEGLVCAKGYTLSDSVRESNKLARWFKTSYLWGSALQSFYQWWTTVDPPRKRGKLPAAKESISRCRDLRAFLAHAWLIRICGKLLSEKPIGNEWVYFLRLYNWEGLQDPLFELSSVWTSEGCCQVEFLMSVSWALSHSVIRKYQPDVLSSANGFLNIIAIVG